MSKASEQLKGVTADFESTVFTPRVRRQEPQSGAGEMVAFSKEFQDLEIEKGQLKVENEKLKNDMGSAINLSMDLIDESPYQIRHITQKDVEELADNLECNPLASPIVVRLKGDGRYELIAGHRRFRAFKLLERTEIPSTIRDFVDDEAHKALVFDNLLPPDLADFEKYLTIKSLQDRFGWSYTRLSDETGLSKTLISYLFSFGKLPQSGQDLLGQNVRCLGANAAAELAKHSESRPDLVIDLIRRLVEEELDQKDLKNYLRTQDSSEAAKIKDPKSGTQFVSGLALTKKPNEVRLKFEKPLAQAKLDDLEQKIAQLVKEFFEENPL